MIRTALPAELKEAHRLRLEAERLHRQAQDEARRIVLDAQATAQHLIDESAAMKEIEQRAQDLLARAERDARAIRGGRGCLREPGTRRFGAGGVARS